jgi:2-polyprenyl-3-methyl-5-hydroxy-6-metoxy-1,4-benzoquinol methylase
VQPAVREELLRINRAFYQSLAQPFASTRRRAQPGVRRVLSRIDPSATVLDAGCGHGLAAEQLIELGFHGTYIGIDSSPALIDLARSRVDGSWATFDVADAAEDGWSPSGTPPAFDWIVAFALLHHVPGAAQRSTLVRKLRAMLRQGGTMVVSVWDFPDVERFRRKQVAWEAVGLTASDVEPGDTLIDWRQGGRGIRYVHRFSSEELEALASQAGLTVVEEFHSDGEGGRMGLYQVWELR